MVKALDFIEGSSVKDYACETVNYFNFVSVRHSMPFDEDSNENLSIIISTCLKILSLIPKKLFSKLLIISTILGLISSIFEYNKLDISTPLSWFSITNVIIVLLLSLVISLTKGFYDYIHENQKEIFHIKESHLKTENELKDKIELIKTQYNEKPTFLDKNLIKNLIKETENYIYIKNHPQIIEEYLPIIKIKRINERIEISALNKHKHNLDIRMIFRLYRRKMILGYPFHDEYGLVSVMTRLDEFFNVILIDVQPEEKFWASVFSNLKEGSLPNDNDFYLKIYIPENILQTDVNTLNNMIEGLKNYG